MITVPGDLKVNLQLLYWEDQTKLKMSQNPDTILSITRVGTNIYNMLPYDVQILNRFRQNTTAIIVEELTYAPTIINVFTAGPPDITKFPPTKSYVDFQKYMRNLRQLRWDAIRRMSISDDNQMLLFQGQSDFLSDGELFQLARLMQSEYLNIEYGNLSLAREDVYISQYQPNTIVNPEVRESMEYTQLENDFIQMCKPHSTCVHKRTVPYFKDSMDFTTMTECIDYRLAEIAARKTWKKERQSIKNLNIRLPVGTPFYEWKIRKEAAAKANVKQNYTRCIAQLESLVINCNIKDLYVAKQIKDGEERMIQDMKKKLNEFWLLQQEKRTIADGDLFDLSMINPRCLPQVNKMLLRPKPEPKVDITEEESDVSSNEEWSGEWSVLSSWDGTE